MVDLQTHDTVVFLTVDVLLLLMMMIETSGVLQCN